MPDSPEKEKRLCIHGDCWAGFMRGGPAHDGPWEFKDTCYVTDPGTAARTICGQSYTSGSHSVLVVSPKTAHEFRITVETEEVVGGEYA